MTIGAMGFPFVPIGNMIGSEFREMFCWGGYLKMRFPIHACSKLTEMMQMLAAGKLTNKQFIPNSICIVGLPSVVESPASGPSYA
jgi:hypothetical protein